MNIKYFIKQVIDLITIADLNEHNQELILEIIEYIINNNTYDIEDLTNQLRIDQEREQNNE